MCYSWTENYIILYNLKIFCVTFIDSFLLLEYLSAKVNGVEASFILVYIAIYIHCLDPF